MVINNVSSRRLLDSRGIAHFVLPLVVVVVVAVIGVFALVASHAATRSTSGVIKVKAYQQAYQYSIDGGYANCSPQPTNLSKPDLNRIWRKQCAVSNTRAKTAALYVLHDNTSSKVHKCYYTNTITKKRSVISFSPHTKDNGKGTNTYAIVARSIRCTPDNDNAYTVWLDNAKEISTDKIKASKTASHHIVSGRTQTVKLGTTGLNP